MATAELLLDDDWDVDDYESISAIMEEHSRLSSLLWEQTAKLEDSDSDRWAGLGPDEVLVIGETLDEVVAQLKERGAPDGMIVTEFLEAEPIEMIL